MSSRGCPYRCTFCFNNFFARLPGKGGGKYVRQRSVEHQMEELRQMHARYRLRYIEFTDDIFTVDKDWVRDFTAAYKREIGVPFQCLVHPRFIDKDVATWLKDAGCQHVQMGVQSVDEEYKRKTLLRMEKDDHLRKSLEALSEAGLGAKLDHILGLPGEPRGAQEAARKLYVEFQPRRVQTFWLTYVPGIDLTKQALADGVLTEKDVYDLERGKTSIFRHPHVDATDGTGDAEFFRSYDVLFRALPFLPRWAQERLRAEHIPSLSERGAGTVGFVFDLANALRRIDKETLVFASHYGTQVLRHLLEFVREMGEPAPSPKVRPPIDDGVALPPQMLPDAASGRPKPRRELRVV